VCVISLLFMASQTCRLCPAVFDTMGGLRAHVTTDHRNVRYYQCDHCEKSYKHYSGLSKHKKTHLKSVGSSQVDLKTEIARSADIAPSTDGENPLLQHEALSMVPVVSAPRKLRTDDPLLSASEPPASIVRVHPSDDSVVPSHDTDVSHGSEDVAMSCTGSGGVDNALDVNPSANLVNPSSARLTKRPLQSGRNMGGILEPKSKKVCVSEQIDNPSLCDAAVEYDNFQIWTKAQTKFDIGDTYCQNIIGFVRNHPIPWSKGRRYIMDYLDIWNDAMIQKGSQLHSIANAYRYVLYYAHFMNMDEDILEEITERVRHNQQMSTRNIFQRGTLDILDPNQLNQVRNEVVSALVIRQKTVIDPFIRDTLQFPENITKKSLVSFGCEELRCFIEIALRFCNVPSRMQVTQYLLMPDTSRDRYVAKLTVGRRQYARVVYQDKVGKVTQPIAIPCGPIISMYIFFYIRYCRVETDTCDHVFVTKTGALWRDATKSVKEYFASHLHLDISNLDKSGRIVHGARRVCLASYALRCNFNEEKLQHMACLMRHSLETARTYYNPWIQLHRARMAARVFADVMDLPDKDDMGVDCLESTPFAKIGRMDSTAFRILLDAFDQHYGSFTIDKPDRMVVQFRDASCQTSSPGGALAAKSISPKSANTVVPCTWIAEFCKVHTDTKQSLHGPCGNSRHAYFAHYFVQCDLCFQRKRINASSKILPLGWLPPAHVISKSSRPRNMGEIESYIRTGLRPSRS
jgi:hypothetical protein